MNTERSEGINGGVGSDTTLLRKPYRGPGMPQRSGFRARLMPLVLWLGVGAAGCNGGPIEPGGGVPTDDTESACGTDPSYDGDGDGLTAEVEAELGTDDCNLDSDGDGLEDGDEHEGGLTNPTNYDTDGDGMGDGCDLEPTEAAEGGLDTDGDGLHDIEECETTHTNPNGLNFSVMYGSNGGIDWTNGDLNILYGNAAVSEEIVNPDACSGSDCGPEAAVDGEITTLFFPGTGDSATVTITLEEPIGIAMVSTHLGDYGTSETDPYITGWALFCNEILFAEDNMSPPYGMYFYVAMDPGMQTIPCVTVTFGVWSDNGASPGFYEVGAIAASAGDIEE